MNLVSFSVFGHQMKYLSGALANASAIRGLGNNWQSVFYCGADLDEDFITELSSRGALVFKEDITKWHPNGMFWRFKAFFEIDYEFCLSRDADSRITKRELSAIQEWTESGLGFHIMRDHPNHETEILGGMWGSHSRNRSLFANIDSRREYGTNFSEDQRFLTKEIYPLIKKDCIVHDSFFKYEWHSKSFPQKRIGLEYVGESVDEFGNFDMSLRTQLLEYEASLIRRSSLKLKNLIKIYLKSILCLIRRYL